MMKLANEWLSDSRTRQYIVSSIGRMIRSEIKRLCSMQSPLCSQLSDDLKNFQWNIIYDEMTQKAPLL